MAKPQTEGRRPGLLTVTSGGGGMACVSLEVMTATALLAEGRKYEVERSTQTEGHKADDLEH